MNTRLVRALITYQGAQQLLDFHDNLLGPVNRTPLRREFDEMVAWIDMLRDKQATRWSDGLMLTQTLAHAKKHLRTYHLETIYALAKLRQTQVPALSGLRLPKTRVSTEQLIEQTNRFALIVEKNKQHLIGLGLAEDFVEDLRAAVAVVAAANSDRMLARNSQKHQTDGAERLCGIAALQLRALGHLVRNHVGADSELAGKWRAATRLPQHRSLSLATPEAPRLLQSGGQDAEPIPQLDESTVSQLAADA